ncbi:DUF3781 domain-containing protein [Draconibacterium halophilum]|uniref:DUF3781 domain-containing protein n=1 Tax=Draconibacterium halophilum TaxID=2706887 RepID=A0A6C0RF78_9BACT|nr:DUF3781 domain-containing protein [Draconibacterium halophilum]QIA07731.1 DUF3781 domain-containing protein [Draconibacterium halophilum]
MKSLKNEIIARICYTDLVYDRINKKLNSELSNDKIEEIIGSVINETEESDFQQKGKNVYITNKARNIRLTINSNTFRIITADRLK